jgi:hypothetical protein
MTANCDPVRERFELPGFVSENRPEFEKVRSISSRSERPLFFARYRHDNGWRKTGQSIGMSEEELEPFTDAFEHGERAAAKRHI